MVDMAVLLRDGFRHRGGKFDAGDGSTAPVESRHGAHGFARGVAESAARLAKPAAFLP
jgi:hypothetical protein